MSLRTAFSRSHQLRGKVRTDVDMHLSKWWMKQVPDNGLVSRHISPFEQQSIMPWMRTWHKRVYVRVTETFWYGFVILGGTYSMIEYADKEEHKEIFGLRD
mmetsp:Transcript_47790/g.93337  ORF Transcript_47790/g.93337 Transcript_47790/m.93337 type:complete len:101 (-) Transcript_47790:218-520(-)